MFGDLVKKEGMQGVVRRQIALVLLALFFAGCRPDVVGPDPVISVVIVSPLQMPFHGAGGPGSEPISITFRWTVLLVASDGGETWVGAIRTRLREGQSGDTLTIETGPETHGGQLRGGGSLEVAQQVGGFFSASLYPGQWKGVTTLEVIYPSGKTTTLEASFAFR